MRAEAGARANVRSAKVQKSKSKIKNICPTPKQLLPNGIFDFCMVQNWMPAEGQYSMPITNKYCYQDQHKEKRSKTQTPYSHDSLRLSG